MLNQSTSVALVDDHPMMVDSIVSLLTGSQQNFTIVATGATARDIIDIVSSHEPDVGIVDLNMPGDVYGAIATIGKAALKTRIVAFTAATDVESAVRALDAGANGFVLKGSSSSELLQAIETVQRNKIYLSHACSGQVITALRDASVRRMSAQAIKLSVRESQIVPLLLQGLTNREIGDKLEISERTVKHYMAILMQKFDARNRLEVVIAAQKLGGQAWACGRNSEN